MESEPNKESKIEEKIEKIEKNEKEEKEDSDSGNEKKEDNQEKKKKKKKKHKKNKNKQATPQDGPRPNPYRELLTIPSENPFSRAQDNSRFRIIGSWKEVEHLPWIQTKYPTKDIDELFPNKDWPIGILEEYKGENAYRTKDEGKINQDKMSQYDVICLRKGAECHRQIRKYAQQFIKPGMKMIDICIELEKMLKFITNFNTIYSGQSFPTGCSLNNCAAHYTPNTGDELF